MAKKIFINYRRALTSMQARLLKEALEKYFSSSKIFLDEAGIDGGNNFVHTLETQIDNSIAMISLISEGWVDHQDKNGDRAIDNPDDFVRFEIARAFNREIPVLPILVDGANT